MRDLLRDEKTGLLYRKWGDHTCDKALLLVHGMGAHTGRWEPMAEYMASNGIAGYAIELEGFGETVGIKGHVGSFRIYYRHIKRLQEMILSENGNCSIFLAGESMGALIVFMAASIYPGDFQGLICVSPAFRNIMKFTPRDYLSMSVAAIFMPRKHFRMPFNSGMCTRDELAQKAMDDDPREHRRATARTLFEIAKAQVLSFGAACKIKCPVMFLLAGADTMISTRTAEKIFEKIPGGTKTLKTYPDMRHALTIEKGKEEVFADIMDWVDKTGRAGA